MRLEKSADRGAPGAQLASVVENLQDIANSLSDAVCCLSKRCEVLESWLFGSLGSVCCPPAFVWKSDAPVFVPSFRDPAAPVAGSSAAFVGPVVDECHVDSHSSATPVAGSAAACGTIFDHSLLEDSFFAISELTAIPAAPVAGSAAANALQHSYIYDDGLLAGSSECPTSGSAALVAGSAAACNVSTHSECSNSPAAPVAGSAAAYGSHYRNADGKVLGEITAEILGDGVGCELAKIVQQVIKEALVSHDSPNTPPVSMHSSIGVETESEIASDTRKNHDQSTQKKSPCGDTRKKITINRLRKSILAARWLETVPHQFLCAQQNQMKRRCHTCFFLPILSLLLNSRR